MALKVIDIDILKLNVDAVVNAANVDLVEGGGICGQIFEKAGREKLKKLAKKYPQLNQARLWLQMDLIFIKNI